MAPISNLHRRIFFFFFFFATLASIPISSVSSAHLHDPKISLFGDAQIVSGAGVKLTRHSASSSGLLLRAKPLRFLVGAKTTSFSTEFSFSISPGDGGGDGLALLFVPEGFGSRFGSRSRSYGLSRENRFLGVEFDTSMDRDVGDLDANHVGVDLCNLVSDRVGDVSSLDLKLNSGEKLKSWVDYDSRSKKLEVRLGRFGEIKPHAPILTYPVDFSKIWSREDVFVGLSSSNGGSEQTSTVHSWRFRWREVHSLAVDRTARSLTLCPLTVLAGTVFATVCGALLAFVMLFLWAILGNYYNVFPVECRLVKDDFGYEEISVIVERDGGGGVEDYNLNL